MGDVVCYSTAVQSWCLDPQDSGVIAATHCPFIHVFQSVARAHTEEEWDSLFTIKCDLWWTLMQRCLLKKVVWIT